MVSTDSTSAASRIATSDAFYNLAGKKIANDTTENSGGLWGASQSALLAAIGNPNPSSNPNAYVWTGTNSVGGIASKKAVGDTSPPYGLGPILGVSTATSGYSSAVNGVELPHCYTGDTYIFPDGYPSNPGDGKTGITAVMNGICCAYTDGSASWVPRRQRWSVYGNTGWFYFNGNNNHLR